MSAVLPGILREPRAAVALLLRRGPWRRDALVGLLSGGCGALRGGSRRRFRSGRGGPVAGGYRRWRARSVGPGEGHEGGECAEWSRVMRVEVGWIFADASGLRASSRCSGQAICENRESTCERLEEAGKCPPERLSPQLRGGLRRSLVWTAVGTHGTRVLAALA